MESRSATLQPYLHAISRNPLLDREGERALAMEIEARSAALWGAILTDRGASPMATRRIGERLPEAKAALRTIERARTARTRARAIQKAAERLHALDADHELADEIVARTGRTFAAAARAVAQARSRFVQANIGLVFHVASKYHSTTMSHEDFVQEGMFGLIKAVDRFDWRQGHRFSTYATWWIRHSMGRALANHGRLVRVPVHVLDARQKATAIEKELRTQLRRDPTRDEVAEAAGMSRDKLDHLFEVAFAQEVRLDAPVGEDSDQSRAEIFVDPGQPVDEVGASMDLDTLVGEAHRHMQSLSPMEREVLRRRFGFAGADDTATFQEIANEHGLSRERIRQIQEAALQKLRSRMRAHASGEA